MCLGDGTEVAVGSWTGGMTPVGTAWHSRPRPRRSMPPRATTHAPRAAPADFGSDARSRGVRVGHASGLARLVRAIRARESARGLARGRGEGAAPTGGARCPVVCPVAVRRGGRGRRASRGPVAVRARQSGVGTGDIKINQIDRGIMTWHGKQKLIRDRDTEQHGMILDSINLTWDCRTVAHGTPSHGSHHGTNGLRRSGVVSKQRRGEGGHSRCRPRAAPTTTP